MGVADRGSFMWLLFSITQGWFALKLFEDVEGWVTALFGSSAAAAIMIAIILFRQEQRDLLLRPLGTFQKEVHQDAISKQGRHTWVGVAMWLAAMIFGSIAL
ncbi:MAG: hypothetical protein QGI21_06280 [Candidatus Poseidoniaceae archaeon]|nr:hypothetical protein [Candidatus Poseidoniaceae archaeon]